MSRGTCLSVSGPHPRPTAVWGPVWLWHSSYLHKHAHITIIRGLLSKTSKLTCNHGFSLGLLMVGIFLFLLRNNKPQFGEYIYALTDWNVLTKYLSALSEMNLNTMHWSHILLLPWKCCVWHVGSVGNNNFRRSSLTVFFIFIQPFVAFFLQQFIFAKSCVNKAVDKRSSQVLSCRVHITGSYAGS